MAIILEALSHQFRSVCQRELLYAGFREELIEKFKKWKTHEDLGEKIVVCCCETGSVRSSGKLNVCKLICLLLIQLLHFDLFVLVIRYQRPQLTIC